MSDEIELFYFVLDVDAEVSSMKISRNETTSTLYEKLCQIVGKRRPFDIFMVNIDLSNLDQDDADLSCFTPEDLLKDAKAMKKWERLSTYFLDDPPEKHLHIIFKPRPTRHTRPSQLSSLSFGLPESPSNARAQFVRRFDEKASAPSTQGQTSEFKHVQADEKRRFHWNRPQDAAATIPVTLLNSIFRQFVEDCDNIQPTAADNRLVRELASTMSEFYESETLRQEEFIRVLKDNSIYIVPSALSANKSTYRTDGDILIFGYRSMIWELKNDQGSKGAEAFCQALLYYYHSTEGEATKHPYANFPCLIGVLVGGQISFSALVWGTRPNYQVLTDTIPLFFHKTDTAKQKRAARYFGAYRRGLKSLEEWYEKLRDGKLDQLPHSPLFPDHKMFTSLDGQKKTFRFTSHPNSDKLIFKALGPDDEKLFVKFTTNYSKAAHEYAQSIGFAPRLRGYDTLPGGWILVVMDDVSDDYSDLERYERHLSDSDAQLLQSKINLLHQHHFVHGDVRAANILVRKDPAGPEQPQFLLVDYDWAGHAGAATYPADLNKTTVWRPEDVDDGELITAEHDCQMLERIIFILRKGEMP